MGAIQRLHRAQMGVSGGGKYIKFADPEVERVLMANGVSSDGVGITLADAESVTSIGTWFKGNTEITSFEEFEKFTAVTSVGGTTATTAAFSGCANLKSIKFHDSVTSVGYTAFLDAPLAISLNLPNLNTISNRAFDGSDLREIVSLGNVDTLPNGGWVSSSYRGVFSRNANLAMVNLPSTLTYIGYGAFAYCGSLRHLFIPEAVMTIKTAAFYNTGISTVILEGGTPPELASNAFNGTPIASGTGYIYVPDASVEAYKAAWATYAAQIKPLSELNT